MGRRLSVLGCAVSVKFRLVAFGFSTGSGLGLMCARAYKRFLRRAESHRSKSPHPFQNFTLFACSYIKSGFHGCSRCTVEFGDKCWCRKPPMHPGTLWTGHVSDAQSSIVN